RGLAPLKSHRAIGNDDPVAVLHTRNAFHLLSNTGIDSSHSIHIARNVIDDPNGIFRRVRIFYQAAHQAREVPQGAQLLSDQENTDHDAYNDADAFGLIVLHKLKSSTYHKPTVFLFYTPRAH